MFYTFPLITHINQCLDAIKDNPNFHVNEKDGYTTINYYMLGNETFPDIFYPNGVSKDTDKYKIMRECRGIAFNPAGEVISRPFHKFFNHGEREEVTNVPVAPAVVLEKLDGSMIRPLYLDWGFRLGTKAGVTDVSMQAEVFIADKPKYQTFIEYCRMNNQTPIFEWCSKRNRIVLEYAAEHLTLLAMRHLHTGLYVERNELIDIANSFSIPLVNQALFKDYAIPHYPGLQDWVDHARQLEGEEGYVMVFSNGHMLKAKAEWYVTLHRAKDLVGREKDLVKLILTDSLDDVLPLLPDADKEAVLKFVEEFNQGFMKTVGEIRNRFMSICNKLSFPAVEREKRKEFAKHVLEENPEYKAHLFYMYDKKDPYDTVREQILHNTGSRSNLEKVRILFNANYNGWSDME